METLTVLIDNPAETVNLLQSALAKERYFLQLGIEKTQARIRQFEQRYKATLTQILDQEREIDHTDLAEWEGETEILQRLTKKVLSLEKIEICI